MVRSDVKLVLELSPITTTEFPKTTSIEALGLTSIVTALQAFEVATKFPVVTFRKFFLVHLDLLLLASSC